MMREIKEKLSAIVDASSARNGTGTSAANQQSLEDQVSLAHERIKQLKLLIDALAIEIEGAKVSGDADSQRRLEAQSSAAQSLLTTAKEDYAEQLDRLVAATTFDSDLEMRLFEVEQLKTQLGQVMQEVTERQRHLADAPAVTLVQPAVIVDAQAEPELDEEQDGQESEPAQPSQKPTADLI